MNRKVRPEALWGCCGRERAIPQVQFTTEPCAVGTVPQSELAVLAEFEHRYLAALRHLAERLAAGGALEAGPLTLDRQAASRRMDIGAALVRAKRRA